MTKKLNLKYYFNSFRNYNYFFNFLKKEENFDQTFLKVRLSKLNGTRWFITYRQ